MRCIFATLFPLLLPSVLSAQISTWQLGGSGGLAWSASDSVRIFIDSDSVPGAIQPIYLTSAQTVFSHLDNWSPWKFPRELGYIDGQRPRAWKRGLGDSRTVHNATYLVDGDSTTYNPPSSDLRNFDWFTFDVAVPVPATRFGFFTPPRGFRSDGTPLAEDAVPAFEVSGATEPDPAWHGHNSYARIEPRRALSNEDTAFTYTLSPSTSPDDVGFDLMRFDLPGPLNLHSVSVEKGAETVSAAASLRGDSLLIALPDPVRDDSVRIYFTTRLVRNATLFALDLGSSTHPGLWQSVEPAARRANIVMLPELTSSNQLIDDFFVSSPTLTPNGDGINDRLEVRFVVLKAEGRAPQVEVFDLAGRKVAVLAPSTEGLHRLFTWDGRDANGASVAPGIYVLRVNLDADAGDDTALRTIAVAY